MRVVEQCRRRQPLDLLPRRGDVGGLHPPTGVGQQDERLVADLVHQPGNAIGSGVDSVVAAGLETGVPIEAGGLGLRPQIGDRFRMIERLEIGANGDPLGKALHLRRPEPLLERRRAGQHDVHRRQRRGRVGQQSQFVDQPQRKRVGLVHQNHEPRAHAGKLPHQFRHRDPQLGLVDPAVGMPKVGEDRLPQGPPGADARAGKQCHLEIIRHALSHLRQQQRLARAGRTDHQRNPLGAADRAIDAMQGGVYQPGRMVELRPRNGHEGTGGGMAAGLMHGFEYPEVAFATSDPSDFDQRPRLPAPSNGPVDFAMWRNRPDPDRSRRI